MCRRGGRGGRLRTAPPVSAFLRHGRPPPRRSPSLPVPPKRTNRSAHLFCRFQNAHQTNARLFGFPFGVLNRSLTAELRNNTGNVSNFRTLTLPSAPLIEGGKVAFPAAPKRTQRLPPQSPAPHRPAFPSPSGFCLRTTLTSHPGSADSSAFPFLLHCVSPRISALGTAAVGLNQTPTGNAAKSPVSPLPHTPTPREQRGIIYISAATQNEGAEGERHFGLQDGRPRAAWPGAPPQPSDAR